MEDGGKVLTGETVWSIGWKVLTGETKVLRSKACPSATSCTTNCMWTEGLSCAAQDSSGLLRSTEITVFW
jgi:hypothetical protein